VNPNFLKFSYQTTYIVSNTAIFSSEPFDVAIKVGRGDNEERL